MAKTLVLAEKPSVARELARVLGCKKSGEGFLEGEHYLVTWALGHLVELAPPEDYDKAWAKWDLLTLPMLPDKMKTVVIPQSGRQFRAVQALMRRGDVSDLVIATDAGREGELVARWIMEKAGWKKPAKRLWISSQTDKAIQEGFAQARIPARMEILARSPLILLDGGHNPGCAAALRQVLEEHLAGKKLAAVMGMMADKDSRTALAILAPLFSAVRTLCPDNPRSLSAEELAEEAAVWCPDSQPCANGEQALEEARRIAGEDGAVIVCGSFYLASEIRPLLLKQGGQIET